MSQARHHSGRRAKARRRRPLARRLLFELMERRELLSAGSSPDEPHGYISPPAVPTPRATPGLAGSSVAVPTFITADGPGAVPNGSVSPVGMTPAQIRQAYVINQITFNGGSIIGDGSGQTIAIVDAFDAPTIASDLHNFDVAFGLSDPPSFKKVAQDGSANLPGVDTIDPAGDTWEVEESLDVEWAHALAPAANMLLVEANSSDDSDLFAAVRYAASVSGVSVVSMSWGQDEDPSETTLDSTFVTPNGHAGVTFVASTGDTGMPGGYPAYSPNVVAVGGTSLHVNASGGYISETGWSLVNGFGGGGGISQYESQPSYQAGIVTQSRTQRTIPDVAFDADPNTGAAIYDSYDFGASGPWIQIGGTSFSAPSWAALIAIADQGRSFAGLAPLDGPSQTLPRIYSLPSSDFHDISSGNNGFAAGPGYDLVTGRGSPIANLLVPDLAHSTGLSVVGSSPAAGSVQSLTGSDFTLYFSDAYNAASVSASAFTVDGIAASSYTLTSSTSITFHFASSPVTSPGLQTMALAAGSITRGSDGSSVAAFQASFRYDPHPIGVSSFAPANGSLVTLPLTTLTVQYSEAFATSSIGAGNLALSMGTVTGYSILNSTTVAYTISGLSQEGTLTASIATGAVTDIYGDPGTAASASFTLDVATAVLPVTLVASSALAAQVLQGTLSGAVNFAGDSDSYTVALAAGQTLSVALSPSAGLMGQVAVSGPGLSNSSSSATAGAAAVLESLPILTAGTYTITVTGQSGGTGAYTLKTVLNAAIENESLGLASDDSLATAQSLAGSLRSLGGAAAQTGAVGSLSTATDQDWYSIALSAGQSLSLDATSNIGAPGLDLRDPSGNVIATGATLGSTAAVNDFLATVAGTYYVRVFGTAAQQYSLMLTENAAFDLAQATTSATAAAINSAPQNGQQQVVGQLGSALVEGFESGSLAQYTSVLPTYDTATIVVASAHDGQLGLSTGSDTEWIYRTDAAAQVAQGQVLSAWLRFDGSATGRAYFGFGASSGGTLSLVVGGNTNQLLLQDNSGFSFTTLAAVSQTFVPGKFYRLQVNWGVGGTIVGQLYDSDGVTLLNTVTASDNSITSGGIAFRGFGNAFDFDSITTTFPATNYYRVQLAAGADFSASTSTPGDSGAFPGNLLDARLQIFNSAGALVASDDNSAVDHRNASLAYTVPAGAAGTYYVAVSPSPLATASQGMYVLTLSGNTLNHAPVLNTSVPMSLPTLTEDPAINAGALVSSMLATGAGGAPISDADAGAAQGIAVTTVDDTDGSWQYSVNNGATWTGFNSTAAGNALLLASDSQTRVRFVPNEYYNGRPASSISFRAWDQTSGANGGLADATLGGNSTGFSSAVGTATITITEINNTPVLLSGAVSTLQVVKGSGAISLGLGNVTYGPGGGADEQSQTLTYTVTAVPSVLSGSILIAGNPIPVVVGQLISLAQLQSLQFAEAATDPGLGGAFSYTVTDNGTTAGLPDPKTLSQSLKISIVSRPETQMLADINPGGASSGPDYFTLAGQNIFFAANDGTHGVELWKTDGTAAGTVLVKDISTNTTYPNSYPRWLTAMNGKVYFEAFDGTDGYELWGSDGTTAGTSLVKDISPGFWSGGPTYIVNLNGELIFQAQDTTLGVQLWKSDGTAAGTTLLKQVDTVNQNGFPRNLTVIGNLVYFSANDGSDGQELWKTDGTTAGTVMVKDIEPGSAGSYPSSMVSLNGELFFSVSNVVPQLWKSDGTAAGTLSITGSNGSLLGSSSNLTVFNGLVYFFASDGSHGFALWKTDGTTAGTQIVNDIDPTATTPRPNYLVNINGRLFFAANDGTHGQQLWTSDGTTAGTVMLTNVVGGANIANLTNVNGRLLFSASDGSNGTELWRSVGTAAGTTMIADIDPGSGSSSPANFVNINGTLYFSANDGTHGTELWTYSHLPPSTTGLANIEIAENSPASAVSLFPAFSDPVDVSPNMTYSIVGDTNSALFSSTPIDPTTGLLTLNYQPNKFGTAQITVQATDSAGLSASASFNVQVDSVNTAPTLNTSVAPHFSMIEENNVASAGDLVSALLSTGAGGEPISDPDPGALQGVAIVAADNSHGTWQFSLNNGASWTAIGSPTATSARLLAADSSTRVRFVPAANYVGNISTGLTIRAWDQTAGSNGATADTTTSGGSSAFSTATLGTSLTVNPLPKVVGVYAKGSGWAASFLSMLDRGGLGDAMVAGLGIELADGANQLTDMLPWSNIDTLSIGFDEGVTVAQSSLTLFNSAGNPIASTGFSYNTSADVATWAFPALAMNKYWISLSSATVTDALGAALDGEWTTSASTFAAGSGDGTAGGDFDYRFNVLPGDANNSGGVTNGDVLQIKIGVGAPVGIGNYRQDVNGSGTITNGDVLLDKLTVGGNIGSLPQPVLPAMTVPSPATPADTTADSGADALADANVVPATDAQPPAALATTQNDTIVAAPTTATVDPVSGEKSVSQVAAAMSAPGTGPSSDDHQPAAERLKTDFEPPLVDAGLSALGEAASHLDTPLSQSTLPAVTMPSAPIARPLGFGAIDQQHAALDAALAKADVRWPVEVRVPGQWSWKSPARSFAAVAGKSVGLPLH